MVSGGWIWRFYDKNADLSTFHHMRALSFSARLFVWIAAGREHTLPIWEGRAHWLREQIGFLLIVLMLNAFFLCSFVFSSWVGAWLGKLISILSFSSTTSIILIAREINVRKWRSLVQTMDLFAGMQGALVCTIAVVMHVAWGGLETSRDNSIFMFSTAGPLILLQVAGTFCPDDHSLHQTRDFSDGDDHRGREVAITPIPTSSVSSDDDDASGDEGARDNTASRAAAGLASAVAPAAARFSGRMAPVRWATAVRAACAVALALADPVLVPVPATVRKPWLSGAWTAWVQISMLGIHVKSTQVLHSLPAAAAPPPSKPPLLRLDLLPPPWAPSPI